MLNLLTLCLDLLLYKSIIIDVEREGHRDSPLGKKEMNEIENCYIHKDMLRDVVDNGFWEILDIRKYFLNEIIYSPFIDYTLDNMRDSNDLLKEINETTGKFVHPDLAKKVSLYYKSEQELVRDVSFYLYKEYNLTYSKELKKRKQKKAKLKKINK